MWNNVGVLLTSSIPTPLHRNNRITLQTPRRCTRFVFPFQRLVARRGGVLDVEVERCGAGLDCASYRKLFGLVSVDLRRRWVIRTSSALLSGPKTGVDEDLGADCRYRW
jgi:hypothetical protein